MAVNFQTGLKLRHLDPHFFAEALVAHHQLYSLQDQLLRPKLQDGQHRSPSYQASRLCETFPLAGEGLFMFGGGMVLFGEKARTYTGARCKVPDCGTASVW